MNYTPHSNFVEHHRKHPDVHQPWHQWSEDETLHVATCYSNPYRWQTRRELFNDFRRHILSLPNVRLHVGELAYGDRPYEVTSPTNPDDYQFRAHSALFHKENVLNQVISRFPHNWKYGAYIDGDFTFTRHDVALETIHQLQHHPWVQMFSQYADLSGETYGTGHRMISTNNGFAFNFVNNGCRLPEGYTDGGWKTPAIQTVLNYKTSVTPPHQHVGVGATGGAWAFTRAGFGILGQLLDVCILGHADWFMTFGLVGAPAPDMHIEKYSVAYQRAIFEWQSRCTSLYKNIGYVDGFATHHFHGSKNRRGYSHRDLILVKHQFDPVKHLRRNFAGVWELADDAIGLRDEIRAYFVSRTEDDPNLYKGC